ncbi:hypothetical protein [Thermococcus sp.]
MWRKVAFITMLILLVSLPPSSGLTPGHSYYLYFNNMLDLTEKTLSGILLGNVSSSKAEYLLRSASTTYLALSSYNSSREILNLASAFVDLERGVFLIVNGSSVFKETPNPSFQSDVGKVVQGITLARQALLTISRSSFSDGNVTYTFNTSSLMETLETLTKWLERNEAFLVQYVGSRFVISASTLHPYAGENVTIIGYGPNMSNVTLLINGSQVVIPTKGGRFSYVFSPKVPGQYAVYALGSNSTGEYKSNVLVISALRVPVKMSLFADSNVSGVYGYLFDELGRPVTGVEVVIRWNDNYTEVLTDDSGYFHLKLNVTSPTWVDALYFGDNVHLPASSFVELFPKRVPLLIKLTAEVSRGSSEALITGNISPRPSIPLKLEVYVDGHPYSTLFTSAGEFTIRVPLEDRNHEVYVVFPGNSKYLPSRSNTLTVSPASFPVERLVSVVLLLLLLGLIYRYLDRRGNVQHLPESPVRDTDEASGTFFSSRVFRSIGEVYRYLYRSLLKLKALPPSTTPRELSKAFKGASFYRDLLTITRLHELEVYGRVKMGAKWLEKGLKATSRVLLSVIIGDEL